LEDEEAIDWREGFWNFHWTRGTSSRKGHGRFTKRVNGECFLGEKLEDERGEGVCERELVLMCEGRISSYVWKGVVHERDVWIHGRISMNKPFDSCFK
jgi:hypothetical protein